MWEQYAEGHKGVCFLFSEAALTERAAEQLGHLSWFRQGLVRYRSMTDGPRSDPSVTGEQLERLPIEAVAEELVDGLAEEIFFEKYDDYASEQEYRFVARSPEELLYVDFGGCLRGVVLGAEFPKSELRPLLFLCAERGLALLRMSWRQGLGQIEGFYNPTIPMEHNHAPEIKPFRDQLAKWHPTLADHNAQS